MIAQKGSQASPEPKNAQRTCDRRDDEKGPDLEEDVDDSPGRRQRVLDLGGDREQLHRREEHRIAEAMNVARLDALFEVIDEHGAEQIDDECDPQRQDNSGE